MWVLLAPSGPGRQAHSSMGPGVSFSPSCTTTRLGTWLPPCSPNSCDFLSPSSSVYDRIASHTAVGHSATARHLASRGTLSVVPADPHRITFQLLGHTLLTPGRFCGHRPHQRAEFWQLVPGKEMPSFVLSSRRLWVPRGERMEPFLNDLFALCPSHAEM